MPEYLFTDRLFLRIPEAARAVIDRAFQQPSVYRVYATTDVENTASQRVLRKVGMQCEGLLRKYIVHPNISAIPRDSYIYAITKLICGGNNVK